MYHRIVRLVTIVGLIAIAAIFVLRYEDSPTSAQVAMAGIDGGTLEIADTDNPAALISSTGVTQTFQIPVSNQSLGGPGQCVEFQELAVTSVAVKLQSPSAECFAKRHNIVVSLHDPAQRYPALATAYLDYDTPILVPQWYLAQFETPASARTDYTYEVVVRTAGQKGDVTFAQGNGGSSSPLHFLNPVNPGNPERGYCPDVILPLPISITYDDTDPYPDGEMQGPTSALAGNDASVRVMYQVENRVNVLALAYNPMIDTVTYQDNLGGPVAHVYDSPLATIQEWQDGRGIVEQAAQTLMDNSGGTVRIDIEYHELNEWPPHDPAQNISWSIVNPPNPPVPLQQIGNWIGWGDNDNELPHSDTYPGYPFIAETLGANRRFLDVAGIANESFDYRGVVASAVRPNDPRSIAELANEGEIDEVWIVGDPSSRLAEGKYVIDPALAGIFNLGSPSGPITSPALEDGTVLPVMGFNYTRSSDSAVHAMGHRAEYVFSRLYGQDPGQTGHWGITCDENRQGTDTWRHFARLFNCHANPNPAQNFGSIGYIHKAFNAVDPYLDDGPAPAYGTWGTQLWNFFEDAPSDEQEWYDFPNFSPNMPKPMTNCADWSGCPAVDIPPLGQTDPAEEGIGDPGLYYGWWFDHLPRYVGDTGGIYNNTWSYIFNPQCVIPGP